MVAQENLHLTLKFLGDVEESRVPLLCRGIEQICAEHGSFDLSLATSGCFPEGGKVRIVWVGTTFPDELRSCVAQIEVAFADNGSAAGRREFSPHITVARGGRRGTSPYLREVVAKQEVEPMAQRISSISLMRSHLSSKGACYEEVFRGVMRDEK